MRIRFGKMPWFVVLLGLPLIAPASGLPCCQAEAQSVASGIAKISWQQPYKADGATMIPGTVRMGDGAFHFYWRIDAHGRITLVILTSPGAGELPPREERLLLLVHRGGTTILFQEWFPLANVRKPSTIRPAATVLTRELFSILPEGAAPPSTPALKRKAGTIDWRPIFERDGTRYLTGRVKTGSGTLEIAWRKAGGRLPELVMLVPFGAGELPPIPIKLYIWDGQARGTAAVCQERQPLLNQKFVPSLQYLALVHAAELAAGFERVDHGEGPVD